MDKLRLLELLNITPTRVYIERGLEQPGGQFLVTGLELRGWGSELRLNGGYEEAGLETRHFTIHLSDCRELQWRVYAHLKHPEDVTLPVSHLVNLRLGSDSHRKPLHLLTDFFGLTVSYGSLTIVRVG